MKRIFAACALLLLAVSGAYAVNPDEMLDDPALEDRARDISAKLRCLVCQNQSIDDSDAELAHDLRRIVRQQIRAGASDIQIKDYLVARYGDFVLLKHPFKATTLLLWLGPLLVLLGGGALAFAQTRGRRAPPEAAELSADERRRLDAMLTGDPGA